MRLRIATVFVSLLTLIGIMDTPAFASVPAGCTVNGICLWTNGGFGGSLYQWSNTYMFQLNPAHCLPLPSGITNEASSFYNNGDSHLGTGRMYMYDRSDCVFVSGVDKPYLWYLSPNTGTSLAGTDTRNDKVSSVRYDVS